MKKVAYFLLLPLNCRTVWFYKKLIFVKLFCHGPTNKLYFHPGPRYETTGAILNRCRSLNTTFKYLHIFYTISDEIVHTISKGDKELERKLRILMLEVEVMRQDGRAAPDTLKADQWQQLLSLNTKNQRSQYLLYLFKIEKSKENQKVQRL